MDANKGLLAGHKISYLSILTHSGINIDLSLSYVEINFVESVFSPCVYGNLIIADKFNLPSYGPILGGEELAVKITNYKDNESNINDEEFEIIELYFAIYNIENKVVSKNRTTIWEIKFCSKEVLWNQQIRICSTFFNKSYSWIANDIFRCFQKEIKKLERKSQIRKSNVSEFFDAEIETNVELEKQIKFLSKSNNEEYSRQTENIVNIHFPNLHPFECFNFLIGRAMNFRRGNPYFFFETITKNEYRYFFESWESLLIEYQHRKTFPLKLEDLINDEKLENKNKFIIINNNQILPGDTKDYFHPDPDMFSAMNFSLDKDFDFLENIRKGVYASSLVTYDLSKKKVQHIKYDWDKMYDDIIKITKDKNNALNIFQKDDKLSDNVKKPGTAKSEYFSHKYPETYIKTSVKNSGTFTSGQDFTPEYTKNFRILKLQELNNNKITINIPGNISFNCGKFTDLFLNSPEITSTEKLKPDPHFAGTYFNLRVMHSFKSNGHFLTAIELTKDSFMDKTIQTIPGSD